MTTLESTFGDSALQTQKTSGLAIAALVCSLIFCCPVTTVLGVLLGIGAAISIASSPARKGMGLAITAIVLGGLFTVGQVAIGKWVLEHYEHLMYVVPDETMAAGFAGDAAGFKANFHGAGATASDAEVQAFIDGLRGRYGTLRSVRFNEMGMQDQQPRFGLAIVPFPYVLEFETTEVDATIEIAFSDPQQGGFVSKLASIKVHDDELGELSYPGGQVTPPPPETGTGEPDVPAPDVDVPAPDVDVPDEPSEPPAVEPDEPPPPAEPDGG